MFCPNCGKNIQGTPGHCPECGANLENHINNMNQANKPINVQEMGTPIVPKTPPKVSKPPKKAKPRKKPGLLKPIISLILSIVLLAGSVFSTIHTIAESDPKASDVKTDGKVVSQIGEKQYETDKLQKMAPDLSMLDNLRPNAEGARKIREEVAVVETAIAAAESELSAQYTEITLDNLDEYMSSVRSSVYELYRNDEIADYNSNRDSIVIDLNAGASYVYSPDIPIYNSGSSPKLKISTYQPNLVQGQYKSIEHYQNYADEGAALIAKAFGEYDFYSAGGVDDNYDDTEVEPRSSAGMGNNNIIIWDGHGCYDSTYGPLMTLGIERTADTDEKYYDMLKSGALLISKTGYFIGADFVNRYIPDNSLDNSIIYIGTCSGGYNSRLADAFLAKGAEAVYAPSGTVLTTYNADMTYAICEGLTMTNSDGTYYNVTDALEYAKKKHGEDDGSKAPSQIKLFTDNPAFSLDWYQDYVISDRDVVLVLDVSGSMAGNPLAETKKAASEFVNTILDENARIGLVAYDSSARMVSNFSGRKQTLINAIESLGSGGGTNIDSAVQMAEKMLDESKAKKKIMVLMTDGQPTGGRSGDSLIEYAGTIKEKGVYIYTLGFFSQLGKSEKASAQKLLSGMASEGHYYDVKDASDLVLFFGDMADTISGQKYIYIEIACPVDVKVSKDGQVLDSSSKNLNTRTDFGTLTFEAEESEEAEEQPVEDEKDVNNDDSKKILRLKDGMEYDIEITGTDDGNMDYTVQYMDANGDYADKREFRSINVTKDMVATTVASSTRAETVLSVDEDGDGKADIVYKAGKNSEAEEVNNLLYKLCLGACGATLLWLVISVLIIVIQTKRRKKYMEEKAATA